MSPNTFRIGAVFPQTEIGADAGEIRAFARGVEALGYNHILAYDHVIGADLRNRPDWNMPYSVDTMFHEPIALLSFLAGVTVSLELVTAVIILPQRQTVLFAQQAANLDIFCGSRLRLGVGMGWNKVEYDALGVPFAARAERLDTQVPLLRKLWTERSLTDSGPFHNIVEAGINPLPLQRPIPIWIGGNSLRAIKRAARIGDGWLPYLPAEQAAERIAVFREETARAGRDPDGVPVESIVFFAAFRTPRRTVDAVVADAVCLQKAGAAGIGVDTMNMGLRGADQHLSLLRRVKDMLVVPPNNPIVR